MNKKEIKKVIEFLDKFPGYLKKSPEKVYEKLYPYENGGYWIVKLDLIKDVQRKLRKEKKGLYTSKLGKKLREETYITKLEYNKFKDGRIFETSINTFEVPKLEKGNRNIHIISGCWHSPFQNKDMQRGLINLIRDLNNKIAGFHLLGDTLDLNSLSSHERGKVPIQGITLGKEYKEGNKFLDEFDKVLPKNIDKSYLYGNHEDRYFRAIRDIDVSKYGDTIPSPKKALSLENRDYKVFENWKDDYFLIGSFLNAFHGEFCTKSPSRTHMDKMKCSGIFVHTHRLDVVYDGERAMFNIGFGGDKNAPCFSYVSRLTKLNWQNAFALVTIDEVGNFHTQVIPVINNHFFYNGKKY